MKVIAVLNIVFLVLWTPVASSSELYGQIHLGATKFPSADLGGTNATLTQDRTGTFFSVTGGYQLLEAVGLELSYIDFGTYSNEVQLNFAPFNSGPSPTYELETDSFSLGIRPTIALSDNIDFDFILGLHRWSLDGVNNVVHYSSGVFQGFTVEENSSSGTDPYYGLGVSYKLSKTLKIKTDVTRYTIDEDDLNVWKIGGEYRFN